MLKAILERLATFFAPKEIPQLGRNEPCPCGSGRKYKKCCLEKEAGRLRSEREAGPMATGGPISDRGASGASGGPSRGVGDVRAPRARQGNLGRGRTP